MKIISFIEQEPVIKKILWHSGLWKELAPRPPPEEKPPPAPEKSSPFQALSRSLKIGIVGFDNYANK
jgi:hypothetical protein